MDLVRMWSDILMYGEDSARIQGGVFPEKFRIGKNLHLPSPNSYIPTSLTTDVSSNLMESPNLRADSASMQ